MTPIEGAVAGDRRTVLVVDDEEPLARVVASYLQRAGFSTALAFDGPTAVDAARQLDPDLVVLDVMLPGFDGVEVCRRLRRFTDCYVIMLTARTEEIDKVVGLSVGADDYIVKPFSPRELLARVQAMLRRPRASQTEPASTGPGDPAAVVTIHELRLDRLGRRAWLGDQPLQLTRTEFDLLLVMADHPSMAFTRTQLIEAVWGSNWYGDEHIVDVHIGHLRRKLDDDAGQPRYLRTVRGIGYGMVTP